MCFRVHFYRHPVLHLVNDIFTECAKAFHQDKEAKRTASGIVLLVDLAIDFLVRS